MLRPATAIMSSLRPPFRLWLVLGALATACASEAERGSENALGNAPSAATTGSSSSSASVGTAAEVSAPLQAATATPTAKATEEAPSEPGDRIYAKARFVWIQRAPQSGRGWVGYLTLGGSVRLFGGARETAKMIGPGCQEWYRVEPDGYVCLGPETTLDPNDPEYVALRAHAGLENNPFPYDYGESLGTPRFEKPPTLAQQRKQEWDFVEHQAKITALREAKAEASDPLYALLDLKPAGVALPSLPSFGGLVREARPRVIRGSTVAWSKAYDDVDGRTWLYTSDHAWVPKDRVRPYPRSEFEGVVLNDKTQLPIAFFRKKDRPQYRWLGETFQETGTSFPRLSHVQLSEERKVHETIAYLKVRDSDLWLREADAAVARKRDEVPYKKTEAIKTRKTWLDVSVFGGTLVAYENETPVFATLISPGRGGTPIPGRDPVSTASTPTGTFRVDGKFRWATMVSSSDSNIVHSEVQYVQNFHGPHALHGAYWHEAFGELKSGGCVNLSPKDSKWVFEWTDPQLPKDWHGMRSTEDRGPPTRVVIRD